MSDPTLEGNREELILDSLRSADGFEAVPLAKLHGEYGRHGSDAVTRPRELAQQRVVLELGDDDRAHIVAIQPLVQLCVERT